MFGLTITPPNQVTELTKKIAEARKRGASFNVTHASYSWFCTNCEVFGDYGDSCWNCDSLLIAYQHVPRWGTGTHNVDWADIERRM